MTKTAKQPEPRLERVAAPVRVDGRNRRSDDDALEGHFARVVSGEHEGKIGSFDSVVSHDPKTGFPEVILLRTRDADNDLLAIPYEDVRPAAPYAGGR